MKYIHLMKLLSVLLCMVMLFAGCTQKDDEKETTGTTDTQAGTDETTEPVTEPETEPETEAETEPDTHAPVDPTLENFFKFEYLENWDHMDPTSLERLDVEFVTQNNHILVYRTLDVDVHNVVTETYTVYNLEMGKVVLEKTHTYPNGINYDTYQGAYVTTDEFGNPQYKYPESMMIVRMRNSISNPFLSVLHLEVTEIEESVREENPNGYYYEIKPHVEYYDMAGNLVASADAFDLDIEFIQDRTGIFKNQPYLTYMVGSVYATLNSENGQLISLVDVTGIKQYGEYDVEANGYGYLMNRDTNTVYDKSFLEVYRKSTGEHVLRYFYNPAADYVDAWVLRNGDVLIQEEFELDEDSATKPDFVDNGVGYVLDHYILDVETGVTKPVEFSYYVKSLSSREDFAEIFELEDTGVTLTENAVNLAVAIEFKPQGHLDNNAKKILVLDNDLEVMFTLDRLIPEHKIQEIGDASMGLVPDIGILPLKNGYYLVDLYNGAIAPRAIVNGKGEVTTYLTEDMYVADGYIVSEDGIYDFGMNLKFAFSEKTYEFAHLLGNKVIVTREVERTILDDAKDEDRFKELVTDVLNLNDTFHNYFVIDLTATTLSPVGIFAEDGEDNCYETEADQFIGDYRIDITRYNQKVEVIYASKDYTITYDRETDKYTLWNDALEHILTTDEVMDVTDFSDEQYLIQTNVEGYTVLYTVNTVNPVSK